MAADLHQCLSAVYEAIMAWLAQQACDEIGVDPVFAHLNGELRGLAVSMHSRRFGGPHLAQLTLVDIRAQATGERMSVTLTAVPDPSNPAPILGLDYVGFGQLLSLMALDLFPVDISYWTDAVRPQLLPFLEKAHKNLTIRKTPDFAKGIFSDCALIAAARETQLDLAVELAKTYLIIFGAVLPSEGAGAYAERQREWLLRMRDNKKEHSALAAIFGTETASQYLNDFLFSA